MATSGRVDEEDRRGIVSSRILLEVCQKGPPLANFGALRSLPLRDSVPGMCRFLAYLGPPRSLDELLFDHPHSLVHQSYQPREMEEALLNADGFGVAWYTEAASTPARYRSVLPMWGDDNLPEMAPHIRSGAVLANVRSATPGIGIAVANTQPFTHGRWAFTHNGYIERFRHTLMRRMQSALGDEAHAAIEGNSDSEYLFGHLLDRLLAGGPDGDVDPVEALSRSMGEVCGWIEEAGIKALLNVAITNGRELFVLRHAINGNPPSLYLRREGLKGGGLLVASEPPFEPDRWEEVSPGRILRISFEGAIEEHPL